MTQHFHLGEYPVVEVTPLAITIDIGRGVHIHIHPGDFPHSTKRGDKLPLYTELTYAIAETTSKQ